MVSRRVQAIDLDKEYPLVEWHPYKKHSKQKIPVVDFDPVQYFLRELRVKFYDFTYNNFLYNSMTITDH